ncbi:tripartite tricarboxylate transporter permease [Cetobacterium sp. 2A]|uniref:tripartite tricarboxylate transporter permease n=1 Tax=Cetobacterium sp. 2A TaxID=2754723 RepID=UPI00163B6F72|nr:tripartite tricarboxylate transporter permease [Cetobacterium sp. 2A]MBC2857131.1 tripartite tricarboxylate transporter permease [Cetobacterium sp. 2A]
MFEYLLNGFATALQMGNLFYLITGVIGGVVIGALPGLTATMGVAILLPFTFGMEAITGLIMLVGIYIGAIYGGSISAILLNTPGTPASAATCLDGYPMVQKGQASKALSASTIASVVGGLVSCVALVTVSPFLAKFALRFSAPEYFALALFGLTIIASISSENFLRGIIAGIIGLLISTVGMDSITSYPRFTFGMIDLLNGFSVIPVLIGLFAVSEVFNQIEILVNEKEVKTNVKIDKNYMSFKEIKQALPTMIKSGILGTFIGSIPGAGADIAAFVCYNEAKRSNKNEKFGEGSLIGISAPEAGNNGVTGGALVPLLTLGVPGDAVAAVLLGALIVQGLTPGPLLFEQNPDIVYGLFSAMILGNIILLGVGLGGIKFYSRIVEIPKVLMIPSILILSTIGSYSMNNSLFDVIVTFIFGIIGYIMTKIKMPSSPIVLAIILGPMLETNLRKAVLMYNGSYSFLWTRPITIVFLILTITSLISAIRKNHKKEICEKEEKILT